MAEETEDKEDPSGTPKTEDKSNKGEAPKSIDELTGGKFKSPEDLAKAYKELESKLGEQSSEVREVREFMSVAKPVFDVIKADPELFKTIDEKLRKDEKPKDSEKPDDKKKATDQAEVRNTTQDLIIKSFEEKHGISKLPADERLKVRKQIGSVIEELTGTDYNGIDLRRLSLVLENAYVLAKNRIEDKSTLEAIQEAEKTDEASISSIPSSGDRGEETLTTEESEVATKLGLTKDEYLSGKKTPAKK